MYSQYDNTKTKYPAQVISIVDNKYNVYFLDGDQRDGVPEKEMKKVSKKQLADRFIGKRFYDEGDPTATKGGPFKKGEFTVLLRGGQGYWCERDTFGDNLREERDIQLFGFSYLEELIEKYDKE